MLKEILSIGGKPGLFKLVSQGKNMLIVESLLDAKRIPVYSSEKAVSLSDVSIYTESDSVPLLDVLNKIFQKEKGGEISINPKSDNKVLTDYLLDILPDYDKDRVYASDIRKIISWYNLLIKNGFSFSVADEEAVETEEGKGIKEKKTEEEKK